PQTAPSLRLSASATSGGNPAAAPQQYAGSPGQLPRPARAGRHCRSRCSLIPALEPFMRNRLEASSGGSTPIMGRVNLNVGCAEAHEFFNLLTEDLNNIAQVGLECRIDVA